MLRNSFKNKKFFVTGATGFKGTWLSLLLHDVGAEVTGYSLDIPTKPSFFEALELGKTIRDIRGDIRDGAALSRALAEAKPDYVLHLAAQPLVRRSLVDPIESYSTNVVGTAQVLESARHVAGVKAIVVVTTDKVYDSTGAAHPHRENDRLGGDDPYSASKACAEIVTKSYYESFLKHAGPLVCTVRAGNVIGGGDWAQNRIIPDLVKAVKAGETLRVRSPKSVRPWQHVLEPVVGYLLTLSKLLEGKISSGESFNFGPHPEAHVEVAKLLETAKPHFPGCRFSFDETGKEAAGELLELRLDWQKAHRLLGWSPIFSLEESIAWTCEWYKEFLGAGNIQGKTLSQIRAYVDKADSFFS